MLKNKKGISLTTMVITVMIMFIIMGTLVYSAVDSVKIRKLNKLYNDLRQLSDAVEVYYLKNGELPVDTTKSEIVVSKDEEKSALDEKKIGFVLKNDKTTVENNDSFVNPNDYLSSGSTGSATYKFLKLSLLENLSLNYGTNEFVVNTKSHTIYYYTGLNVGKDTYYYLPLKYTNTSYNTINTFHQIGLKEVAGITSGKNIFFSTSSEELNLKDLLEFSSDETGEEIEPEELTYSLSNNSDYYTISKDGILKRKEGIIDVADIAGKYSTEVTVEAKNYGDEEPESETFTVYTSSINIYENSENEEPVDHINLVTNEKNDTYVYQKNSTENSEYKVQKNGYLSTKNNLKMIATSENSQVASATYNNNNNDKLKLVVFKSGTETGSTDITLENQSAGFAKDTVTVNVFDFKIYSGSVGSNTNIDRLDFYGLGDNQKTNVKLNIDGPSDFKFDNIRNKIEWSIVEEGGNKIDNSGIVTLTQDSDVTKATIIPEKVGKTYLRCIVTVENEKLVEMLIPITVSGIETVDGTQINNDTISFKVNEKNTVDLKYSFGDSNINSAKFEIPTIVPNTDFNITRKDNNVFTITYNGNSEITSMLTIVGEVDDKKYEDTINIVVSN